MKKKLLIAIDGPDGCGKSSLANLLAQALHITTPCVLVKPTYFSTTEKSAVVGRGLKRCSHLPNKGWEHNAFFLRAMSLNYRHLVRPLIDSHSIVVLDSSEIRALAFVQDGCSDEAVRKTEAAFLSGRMNHGCVPDIRFLLDGSNEDLIKNLGTKASLDEGDPRGHKAIDSRRNAYAYAQQIVLSNQPEVVVHRITIKHSSLAMNYHAFLVKQMMALIGSLT